MRLLVPLNSWAQVNTAVIPKDTHPFPEARDTEVKGYCTCDYSFFYDRTKRQQHICN